MCPFDVLTLNARLLVQQVNLFKIQVNRVNPEGLYKCYLESLLRTVVAIQTSVRLMDFSISFVRYLRNPLYKEVVSALSFDPGKVFRQAVERYENRVNDLFLFNE